MNQQGLDGIRYLSRYGHDVETWAVFEPFRINTMESNSIVPEDPDFQAALRIHSLQFSSGDL